MNDMPRSAKWADLCRKYGLLAKEYKAQRKYADYVRCSLHAQQALERMRNEIAKEARR